MKKVKAKVLEQELQQLLAKKGLNPSTRKALETLNQMLKSGSFIFIEYADHHYPYHYKVVEKRVEVSKNFKPVIGYHYQLDEQYNFPEREWEVENWGGLSEEEKEELVDKFGKGLQSVIEFARKKAGENLPAVVRTSGYWGDYFEGRWRENQWDDVNIVVGDDWITFDVAVDEETKWSSPSTLEALAEKDEVVKVVKEAAEFLAKNFEGKYEHTKVYRDYDESQEWEEEEETSLNRFIEEAKKNVPSQTPKKEKGNSPSP